MSAISSVSGRRQTTPIQKGFRSAAAMFAGRVLAMLLTPVVGLLLVRELSVEQYGAYKLISHLLFFGLIGTSLGLPAMLARYAAELAARNAFRPLMRVFLGSLTLQICSLAVSVVGFVGLYAWLENYFQFPPIMRPLLLWILLLLASHVLSAFLENGVLTGLIDQAFTSLVRAVSTTVMSVALIVSLHLGYRLEAVIGIQALVTLVVLVIYVLRTFWLLRAGVPGGTDEPVQKRRLVRFASFTFLSGTVGSFRNIALDNLVIAKYLGIEGVAIYGFAGGVFEALMHIQPGELVRGLMNTLFTQNYARYRDLHRTNYFFQLYTKLIGFAGLPMVVLGVLFADPLIRYLLAPTYLSATLALQVLLIFGIVRMFGAPFGNLLVMLERNEFFLIATVFGVYNLGMDILLVPRFGILGAAIATGTASPLVFAFNYVVLRYYLKVPLSYPWRSLARLCLNVGLLALAGIVSVPYVNGIATAIVLPVVLFAAYLGLSVANRVFDDKDRETLNHAIGRKLWVF